MAHDTSISVLGQRPGADAGEVLRGVGAGSGGGGGVGAVRSLYIHVPFCVHKCHYCDFYSFVDTRDQQGAFVERLVRELGALSRHATGPLRTVFVGGGTPSLLRPELWSRVLAALAERFDLSEIRRGAGEFTVECNPESVTGELLGVLRGGGVDRISMGAQSFDRRHLRTLERRHDPEAVGRALGLAAGAGFERTSIDLIFGIPGQTVEEWSRDLDAALALGTTHLSCYALTYEPNTAMTARMRSGEFARADEDLEADLYELCVARCRGAGLERYEVSNFARGGRESLHNLAYWRQEQWLAAGPSASGQVFTSGSPFAHGHLWKNVARLGDYLEGGRASGYSPIVDHEGPDAARALRERIMMGIRLAEGISGARTARDAEMVRGGAGERMCRAAAELERDGLMTAGGERWALTDRGFLVADFVARRLAGEVR
ncbi:MAG: radical SAM family heme chaperone HemW [Phycisphaerae bacterium]|nr:radical SAM family heme chaperone HemW [Phycisphaerae bacterium]